jgi:hypothetical protein
MSISEVWSVALAVLASIGGGGILTVGLSSWIGKVWADRILEREKASLQKQFAEAKLELDKSLHRHNVAVTRIDTQRVEAIRDLYGALIAWNEVVWLILAPNNFETRNYPDAINHYTAWNKALLQRSQALEQVAMRTAIYFSEDTYQTIARCGLAASIMSIEFADAVEKHADLETGLHFNQIEEARAEFKSKYEAEYEPARRTVITEFRRLVDPTAPR